MTKRYDNDESHILRDGELVRVPLMMKDSWQRDMHERSQQRLQLHDGRGGSPGNRPGFAFGDSVLNRDERESAYAAYERDLTAAYKTGRRTCVPDQPATPDAITMEEIFAQYLREIRNS
jgi:hypothetical protein